MSMDFRSAPSVSAPNEIESAVGCVDELRTAQPPVGLWPSGRVHLAPTTLCRGFLRTRGLLENEIIAPTGTASE